MRIFPIEWPAKGKLAVVTRPAANATERELAEVRAAGYTTVVSLLAAEESRELGLAAEEETCVRASISFVSHPIPDFSVPANNDAFREKLFELHDTFRSGAGIAAHCRGSVGRSPLLIASLLVLDGATPDDAWDRVSRARGVPVPDTDAQRNWIRSLTARGV